MEVRIWCMRQPERDAHGRMTERGKKQVAAVVREHFRNVYFSLVLRDEPSLVDDTAAEIKRIIQTEVDKRPKDQGGMGLTAVMFGEGGPIEQPFLLPGEVINFPGLSYVSISDPRMPPVNFNIAEVLNKPYEQITVYEVLERFGWVGGYLSAYMVSCFLRAIMLLQKEEADYDTAIDDLDNEGTDDEDDFDDEDSLLMGPFDILMIGGGPGLELAAKDPRAQRLLGPADIIRYTVSLVQDAPPTIDGSDMLACPKVE